MKNGADPFFFSASIRLSWKSYSIQATNAGRVITPCVLIVRLGCEELVNGSFCDRQQFVKLRTLSVILNIQLSNISPDKSGYLPVLFCGGHRAVSWTRWHGRAIPAP